MRINGQKNGINSSDNLIEDQHMGSMSAAKRGSSTNKKSAKKPPKYYVFDDQKSDNP